MKTFVDGAARQAKDFFSALSRKEIIRLSILAALIIILGIVVAYLLGKTNYVALYSNLKADEAGQILIALEDMGVDARPQGAGTILVPEEEVAELRMRLANEGFQSGGFTTDIFSQATGFGTTNLEKQTYLQYQTQANIRQQLLRLEKIDDCLVIVNYPQESSFVISSETEPASASVMLEIKNGDVLTNLEAKAIAETVAMGVPGLRTENIRIIDSKGMLYSIEDEDDGLTGVNGISYQLLLEKQVRDQLESQVNNLLAPVFGAGQVKTAVNVTLNFDKEVSQEVKFDPPIDGEDSGIIVSMSELYEQSRLDAAEGGIPGTDTNGLGLPEYPYDPLGDDELYSKVLREINYEINETTTQIERAQGTVEELSIAVLLDSETITEDYTANVRNLVAKAIGVGDSYISVERLPFRPDTTLTDAISLQEEYIKAYQNRELMQTIIICLTLLLLALFVVLFVRSVLRSRESQATVLAAEGMEGGIDFLAGSTEEEDIQLLRDMDMSLKSEEIGNIEKFIDKDPAAVAQMLRNWLADDYR